MTDHRIIALSRIPGAVLGLAVVASTVIAVSGGTVLLLWAAALCALVLGLRPVAGWMLSIALGIGILTVGEFALLLISGTAGLPLPVLDISVWAVVGLGGAVVAALHPPTITRGMAALGAAAASGSVVLLTTITAAQVAPGAVRVAWAMNGDFVNSLNFARFMVEHDGIGIADLPQATPLPFGMMASAMSSGRGAVAASGLLEHDVTRAVELWVLVCALICALAGLLVAQAAARVQKSVAIVGVIAASVAGLTWYVFGVQVQFGFINSGFAIVLLLAAWLAYNAGEARPMLALTALFLLATALLLAWGLLVLCVAGLGLALILRHWRTLRTASRAQWIVLAVSVVPFLAYALFVIAPGFARADGALGNDGGFPLIGPVSIYVIVAVLAVVAIALNRAAGAGHLVSGVVAFTVTYTLGIGFLLYQRIGAANGWGYYPAKFAWTGSIVLIILIIVIGMRFAERFPVRSWRDATLGVAGLLVVVTLLWAPNNSQPTAQLPLVGIATGGGVDNRYSDLVFALSDPGDGHHMLWNSALGDFWPNFWLLQTNLTAAERAASSFAHHTSALTEEEVCEVAELFDGDLTIHTADPDAESTLRGTCPDVDFRVVVDGS